jgi:hypothetical protein
MPDMKIGRRMAINNQGCGEGKKGGDVPRDVGRQPFGSAEAMAISIPHSGQPCALAPF